MKKITIKHQLIIFLLVFAIFLSVKDKDIVFIMSTAIAVLAAVTVETALNYIKSHKLVLSDSAVITGLIIGFVLYDRQPWWVFVAAPVLAIVLKYSIKFKGRHIFNPAAAGIFLTTVFFSANTQWMGTYEWYILAPVGLYFIYKIRKIELLASYILLSLVLFGAQALLQKAPLSGIFGYLSYFYIFIMLIEPLTTPVKPLGKIIFGALVAVLIFILTGVGVRFDVELAALLAANILVPLLNKIS